MNTLRYLLIVFLLFNNNSKIFAQEINDCAYDHQPRIVIQYLPKYFADYYRHVYTWFPPQVDYLKIPESPYHIISKIKREYAYANGHIFFSVLGHTDGKKTIEIRINSEYAHDSNKKALSKKNINALIELTKENIMSWRFREHIPTQFQTQWKYVFGDIIDSTEEVSEGADVFETDTVTMDIDRMIEIVMFPKAEPEGVVRDSEFDVLNDSCSNKALQVEYLKIPVGPIPGFPWEQNVILHVKTDGRKVISVEALKYGSPIYRDKAMEDIKTWLFKEHKPTEFVSNWKYFSETVADPKPTIVTLDLPHRVEVKSYWRLSGDPVIIFNPKVKRKKAN